MQSMYMNNRWLGCSNWTWLQPSIPSGAAALRLRIRQIPNNSTCNPKTILLRSPTSFARYDFRNLMLSIRTYLNAACLRRTSNVGAECPFNYIWSDDPEGARTSLSTETSSSLRTAHELYLCTKWRQLSLRVKNCCRRQHIYSTCTSCMCGFMMKSEK